MTLFCTIASRYALPHVRVLATDLERHHPGARLATLVLGGAADTTGDEEPFDLIRPCELDAGPTADLASHGWADIAAILRPGLLRLMLERGATTAVHLEADVHLTASLDPFAALARESGVALLARVPEGLPIDGLAPDDRDLLAAGRISPALVGVSAGAWSEAFLRWWSDRVLETARSIEPSDGQATNLAGASAELCRWLDLAPAAFGARVAVLDDPGFGVSFWNLHARELSREGNELRAAGVPVRCIHFSGFRPDRPYWLSGHGTRVRVLDDPPLMDLCAAYGTRLMAAGWVNAERRRDRSGSLADGTLFDERLRRLHASAVASGEAFGDISTTDGTEAFVAWLTGPAADGGHRGVNGYLYDAYLERSDLCRSFPDLGGADASRLVEWAWEHGRSELGLDAALLPPLPGGAAVTADRQIAVNVVGYLTETLGLGEAARLYVTALRAAAVPVSTAGAPVQLPVEEPHEQALARYGRQRYEHRTLPYDAPFNLLCVNPDALPALLEDERDMLVHGGYTIGQWGWETDVLPPHWLPLFDAVDEIWVYSRYVADMIGRWSPVPVVTVPLPVVKPDPGDASLDLDVGDGFVFLFVFDFFSTLQRKNPAGVIEAFTHAFSPGEGPRLVLKAMNGSFRPEAADALRWKIGDRPDITLIDRHVDRSTYAALLTRCDCYVSLHRAEGFGLTIAESMALGKPVIATGYSGNTDFMTSANSYLVDYTLTKVGHGADHYPAQGTWAEPHLGHAARLMRHVWEEGRDEALEKGARAARDLEERLSPEAAGSIARARLERIATSRGTTATRTARAEETTSFAAIDRHLALDLGVGIDRGLGPSRLLRRIVLRLIRPFTHHERALDVAIVGELRRVSQDVAKGQALSARERARVRELEAQVSDLERSSNGHEPSGTGAIDNRSER
jgi:glycosyltransferase involved in cell wall biosynthesis